MTDNHSKDLLDKYNKNLCTEEEKALVESWYLNLNETEIDISQERIAEIGRQIQNELPTIGSKNRTLQLWAAVSTIAATIVIGISIWVSSPKEIAKTVATPTQDVAPGGNRATLTLADGHTIQLSHNKKGVVINSAKLTYDDGAKISTASITGTQTVNTPKGGQYQIQLADGTKVWLNAASSLSYPALELLLELQ